MTFHLNFFCSLTNFSHFHSILILYEYSGHSTTLVMLLNAVTFLMYLTRYCDSAEHNHDFLAAIATVKQPQTLVNVLFGGQHKAG